jgi:hypothetical protein
LLALGKSDLDDLTANFPVAASKILLKLAGLMAVRLHMLIHAEFLKDAEEQAKEER